MSAEKNKEGTPDIGHKEEGSIEREVGSKMSTRVQKNRIEFRDSMINRFRSLMVKQRQYATACDNS